MPIIDNVLKLITQGGGTVNAITATLSPAIPPSVQCMVIVRSTGVNTSTSVTFELNGWPVYPVKARGNFALRTSDTGLAGYEMILVFNTTGSYWQLLNPATSTILESTTIAAADATTKANAALAAANAYTDLYTLAQAISANNHTNEQSILSDNEFSYLSILDLYCRMTFDNGAVTGGFFANASYSEIAHETKVTLNTPNVELPQETASLILSTDATKNIKGLPTATYPSLTELSYVKGVTSAIQTQLNGKVFPIDFGNITNWAIADNVTYYLGLSTSVGVSTDQISFVPLYAGTIVAILTEVFSAGTVGSNTEDGILTLFYNGGLDSYEIASDFKMGANRHFQRNFTGLNIPVNTDVAYLRFEAPPYATNPSAIQLRVTLIIKP